MFLFSNIISKMNGWYYHNFWYVPLKDSVKNGQLFLKMVSWFLILVSFAIITLLPLTNTLILSLIPKQVWWSPFFHNGLQSSICCIKENSMQLRKTFYHQNTEVALNWIHRFLFLDLERYAYHNSVICNGDHETGFRNWHIN